MGKNYDEYDDDIIEKDVSEKPRPPKKAGNRQKKGKKVEKNGKHKKKRSFKAKFFMFLTTLLVICCVAVSAFLVCYYLGVFEDIDTKPGNKITRENNIFNCWY